MDADSNMAFSAASSGDFSFLNGSGNLDSFFAARDSEGNTLLHVLVSAGGLPLAPEKYVTKSSLLVENHVGETVFQRAASRGLLKDIPARFMTYEMLVLRHLGNPIAHIAAEHGFLSQIPKKLITNALVFAGNRHAPSLIECAIVGNCVGELPEAVLTRTNFLTLDSSGNDSLLHSAARVGLLNRLPRKLLVPKLLNTRNSDGETVLHAAAYGRCLDAIPTQYLKREFLLYRDNEHKTVLASAVGCKEQLLGLHLPDITKQLFGIDWWEQNNKILYGRRKLRPVVCDGAEIEMF